MYLQALKNNRSCKIIVKIHKLAITLPGIFSYGYFIVCTYLTFIKKTLTLMTFAFRINNSLIISHYVRTINDC